MFLGVGDGVVGIFSTKTEGITITDSEVSTVTLMGNTGNAVREVS